MIKELLVKDGDIDKKYFLETVHFAIDKKIDTICSHSSIISPFIHMSEYIDFSALIDYPCGLSNIKTKLNEISYCSKLGIKYCDITVNRYFLHNADYSSIDSELVSIFNCCKEQGIHPRILTDYRAIGKDTISALATVAKAIGYDTIIPATGSIVDDSTEQMINCHWVEKSGLNVIACGIEGANDKVDILKLSFLHGVRFLSKEYASFILKSGV
jgi:deoxyribose-phosphate aldolase